MWTVLAAIVGGVFPLLTALFKSYSEPRLYRRLERQLSLLEKTPDGSEARASIASLVAASSEALREREVGRLTRKLNGANVAAVVFVVGFGALVDYWIAVWFLAAADTPWAWLAATLFVVVTLFFVALTAVGVGSIYAPKKPDTAKAK